jgi:hypothetical protein
MIKKIFSPKKWASLTQNIASFFPKWNMTLALRKRQYKNGYNFA